MAVNMLPARPPWAGAAFSIASFGFVTGVLLQFRFLGGVKRHQTGNRKRREACSASLGLAIAKQAAACKGKMKGVLCAQLCVLERKAGSMSAWTCFELLFLEVRRSFTEVGHSKWTMFGEKGVPFQESESVPCVCWQRFHSVSLLQPSR